MAPGVTNRGAGWKKELAQAFTQPRDLLDFLALHPDQIHPPPLERSAFPLRVPRAFAQQMRRGDPKDPLLRQVLAVQAETLELPGFKTDPVDDASARIAPGLLQKYQGRALLIATGACAAHCRYCFRRHYPYREQGAQGDRLQQALAVLEPDATLNEVILSGGDPLMLDDPALAELITALERLTQLKRLRIHSRLPTLLPSRITHALCARLRSSRFQPVLVVHINHPAEIGLAAAQALQRLAASGTRLLNQSVLLRGVNDDRNVLSALSERLFAAQVLPYYLHLLDPVSGAAHFDVPEAEGRALIRQLRDQLPGYLVPRLVREQPGAPAKTVLC
jgi:EF-P beta-lysylation protein EpmB